MDRRIKFRHLEVFAAVARSASLKRAAEQLNLTQPAVSKTLKELEDIVGHSLAERSRAGVRLTAQGDIFLTYTEQSIAAVKHGLRSLQDTSVSGGRLRIGALPSVASSLLPEAIQAFARDNPDTLVEVFEGPHDDLRNRLRNGGLDMVIGRLPRPETMDGLVFQQLYTEDVAVVARPDSPAVGLTAFQDLEAFRVIYPPKDTAIRPLVARMLISAGVPLYSNRIETASAAVGRALLLADTGTVWIISEGVVAHDLQDGTVARLHLDTRMTSGAVGIITRADDVKAPPAQSLIRLLMAQVEKTRPRRGQSSA